MNSSPYAGRRALLKFGAFVLLCSLPWTAQAQSLPADRDGNGLIEIDSLLMLHNMRYNLAGVGYKTSTSSVKDSSGCPAMGCIGYELTQNLDFDVNGDGSTWSGNAEDGFTLDSEDSQAVYFPVDEDDAGGWSPIGSGADRFVAVFDGKGHTISNLAIRRTRTHIGLFGVTGSDAVIRNLGLVDNLADYTGSSGNLLYIGGLVGLSNGSITASYATGDADGGGGNFDNVGGLVGEQKGGSITASYATGDAHGGSGQIDRVGGLVGWQSGGSTTASYATGDAHGGDSNFDYVGGLVGEQKGGSITASYATGDAHGGGGGQDRVGRLVGRKPGGSITASYGFGGMSGKEVSGSDGSTKPPDVSTAAQLTADNAGSAWNDADSNTLGAWDFGTDEQIPALNYADYDGAGTVFDCSQFPANACGTLGASVDHDGDGLIEIDSLTMLHNMRHNLAGTSYKESASALGAAYGCPAARCRGYELTRNLDFDVNGDGSTWSGNAEDGFTLDSGDSQADYFPVADDGTGGWLPIGSGANPFVAVFDGNTHTISNLAIRRSQTNIGLFGVTGGAAVIRNLGLVDNLADYTGSSNSNTYIGGLVGQSEGSITASYATGDADGGDGNKDIVGGLVGQSEGSITASYATGDADGGDGNEDLVGGLVGLSRGSITASYATGDADGGNGNDVDVGGLAGRQGQGSITASYATGIANSGNGGVGRVGGLVGYKYQGSITASYATGDTDGGGGANDRVGGLVGQQREGSITASYATGDAHGGSSNYDRVGGLVGVQEDGSITASYATGDADGGDGDDDRVGELVGRKDGGSITASYAFGETSGEIDDSGSDGSAKPAGVGTAADLTALNAGTTWNSAADNTLDAWYFGTDEPIPALNYADYDGAGTVFDCSQFPTSCGTPLPRQAGVNATGLSEVAFGATTTITGSLVFGRVAIVSWSWEQLQGPNVTLIDANTRTATFTAPATGDFLLFELTATDSDGDQYTDRIRLFLVGASVDQDGNGLIEIDNLLRLHNMRHNLAGTSYKTSASSAENNSGCPGTGCIGYELTENLDFDVDGDGTWSGNAEDGFTLDSGDTEANYFPVDAGGWLPIGSEANPFVAVFDGKGHTISNLAIRRNQTYIGLFGATGGAAVIRNLGLVDNLADYTGSSDSNTYIGGLVGQSEGSITASYATGDADGGDGKKDRVGGLVGVQEDGSITASYATGDADGGKDNTDIVGGLVGQQKGSITASYATGDADGGGGLGDRVGGLVGYKIGGSITASYATGDADGGSGDQDRVGGLVGQQSGGSITASYATGDADGGVGNQDYAGGLMGTQFRGSITASYAMGDADGSGGGQDRVGGLVGYQDNESSITASYATGDADGGGGGNDHVGGLVGRSQGSIVESYGFGGTTGGETNGPDGSTKATGVVTAADLTAIKAGITWNSAATNTLGAWDFGTDVQIPALNYADYDGVDLAVFDCGQFPANACGTLLPGQDEASASGTSAVAFGATTTITGSLVFGRVAIVSWSWEQLEGTNVTLIDANTRTATFRAPATGDFLLFELTATDSGGDQYTDRIRLSLGASVDQDGDGLIEIDSLTMLHNMRHNLAGTSYKESASAPGAAYGCPVAGCRGYELTRNLDFDVDGDGSTWSGNAEEGFTLNMEDTNAEYFLVTGNTGGWVPIGDANDPFVAVFDGNGHKISNLAIRRDQAYIGLFGATGGDAVIRNLGLVDNLADYTGSSDSGIYIGGLAGRSYGSITASYATGDAHGGGGESDYVGGLVGLSKGSITASYATGDTDGGGGGQFDHAGGLVGYQEGGSITASYATGDAHGGEGRSSRVGGLVGRSKGSITASYATGDAHGGSGGSNKVGKLVGLLLSDGSITASYGFGGANGGGGGADGSPPVSTAAQLTAVNAGSAWNSAANNTLGAWNFGTDEQIPALNYADYDGPGSTVFDCGQFPAGVCGTLLPGRLSVRLTLEGAATVAEGARVTLSAELSSVVANETVVRLVVVAGGPNAADDADIVIEGDVFSVTIAMGTDSGTTEFTVLDDDIDEGAETLVIGIAGGDLIPDQIIEVTILDNDTRGVEISTTSLNLTEGERGTYTVVLTSQPNTGSVTVIAASSDPDRVRIGDITAESRPSDLVFSTENWHIPRIVQIITFLNPDETDTDVAITHQVVADVGGDYAGETAADVVVTVGQLSVSLTLEGSATVAEGARVTLSAELSSAVANETVLRLVVVAGGANAADDADIVIEGDEFRVTIAVDTDSGTTEFTVLDDDIDEEDEILMVGIAGGALIPDQIIEVTILDDDTRGVEISATNLNLTEGESGSYAVVLTSQPNTGSVTVIAASSDPDRVRIGDITAESMPSDLIFSTENWHIPRIVQIITFLDPDETDTDVAITHRVVADVSGDYTGETAADVVVTVSQLSVSLTLASSATVAEGARVTLSAELSSFVANETVVRLVVVPGGANAAADADIVIEGDEFRVTIAMGTDSGTTEFTVLDDDIDEEDETLMVGIAGGDLTADQIIEVTILDDDTRGVEISTTSLNLTEGERGTYTVVLTSQPNTGSVTVIAASSDPVRVRIGDITAESMLSDLVFSAENWHIPRIVQIITFLDPDETDTEVAITHQVVADVGGDYTGETAADLVVTVGQLSVSLTLEGSATVAEGARVTLSAELPSVVANETVVRLVVVPGGPGTADDADIVIEGDEFRVTIAVGTDSGTTEFTVLDDDIDEEDETLVIGIAGRDLIADQIIEVTILDNDTRGVEISATRLNLTEGERGSYTVVLTSQPNTGSVTVIAASSDPDRVRIGDITAGSMPSDLVFSAENWHIPRIVQIITFPDPDGTDTEVEITHRVVADVGGDYADVTAADVVVTVEEVSLTLEGASTVAEGTRVTLSAELSSAVANETVVRLVVVAGGPGTADDADIVIEGDEFSVIIAAGAASGTTAFTVLDDDIDEEHEILMIGIAAGGDLISDQIIEVTILDNDTRGVEISATRLNLTEGERGNYTVVLTSQPNTGNVTVTPASGDLARVRIGDITAESMPSDLIFSTENWHIPRIVQIITFPDPDGTDAEVEITHRVVADVGGDYADVTAADLVVTVEEVSLTLEGASTVAEGARVTLSAELSSAVANETVVRLVVVAGGPGTADDADIVIEGDEFSVIIAAGAARGTTEFTVLDDDIDEEDEILMIAIAGGDLISDQIIEVTILDNDTRGVEISATSLNLTEGERGTYTVVLTSQPNTGNVTVAPASGDLARVRIGDITAGSMPSDLIFSTENWHIPRIVQIITFPDPDGTDAEVEITHQVVADVSGDYADVTAADLVVTVEEVSLTLEGASTVAEGTRVTLSAELSSAVANETVVRLVVVAGGPGTADDADIVIEGDEFSVIIAAGAASGTTEFTVLDDDIDEEDEILMIGIAGGDLISDQIIEVTILDNDTRGVEISTTSLNLTEGESGTYTVVLTSQPNTGSVTVIAASSDPARVRIGDITAESMPSDLIFSTENWHIPRIVQIITFLDPDETDIDVAITHQVVADAGGDYADVTAADVVVTVEDAGGGTVSLTLEGSATVAEGTRVTLSAGLSSVVAKATVVRLVVVTGGPGTADDADIVIEGDEFRVTIAAGVARGTTTFTVLDDDIDEEDETLIVGIAGGDLTSDQIIEVTILDNDTRGVEISATSLNLTEGERGSYTVVLTSQPNTGSVTVIAASSDPTRVRIDDILVFSTENWDIPQIVQIITFPDPDGTDTEVEITHRVVADVGGDYADVKAADVVVTVEEGENNPVFELAETISIAVFLEKSILVAKPFLDRSGERSSPTVVILEAPYDLVVKFDKDAGDYGAITLRRFLNTGENGEQGREVKLAVLGAQGGRTEVTLDIERLAPLPEIKISGEIIGIEPNLLLFTLGEARSLAASLKGGPIAGVMWRAEVSKGDSVAVDAIGESGEFTLSASSLKTGQSELTLTAFDDNGRRREQSFPVAVAAAEAKPRLKLSVSTRIDGSAKIVSGFAVDDDILIEATLEGAAPSLEQLGAAGESTATVNFRITVAKLGADGTPEESVMLPATAKVGSNAPALRIEPVPVGAERREDLSLEVGDLVRVSIGHLVATESSASEVSHGVIAGDALLLPVLATAIVDSDNDGLSDTVVGESEPDTLGPITAAIVEVTDSGVRLTEAVSLSLSLGDLARSLGLGGCGGVSLTLTLGADDGLAGCGDADPISPLAIKTLTMTAQERFGEGDYQLFDFSATFDSSEIAPDGLLVINLPVDPETHRVYRFDSDSNEWVPVIDAGLPNQPATGSSGVLNSIEGNPGVLDSLEDDCETCFYALDFDRDGSVELLLLSVPVDPEAPSFEVVDADFQDRWFSIDAGETITILLRGRGLGGLTTTVTIVENANVRGRYIQTATIGGLVGPAVELYGLRRTRNGPVAVLVEALGEHGEAVAGIAFDVAVRNQDPTIKFRLPSGEETTSLALRPNTSMTLDVIIADPDGDTEFDLALTSGGDFAILKPGPNPKAAIGTASGGDDGGDVVINRLILTSGDGASPPFTLTFEATDRSDKSKSLESLTVCVLNDTTGKCPTSTVGGGGGGGGGGGSLGLWALVALALAHPLGPWRRRGRHSRAPSHLSDPLA